MTPRLPTVGGDDGDWGAILNAFLRVSHDDSGHILGSAIAQAGGVTTNQVGGANGVAGLNSSSIVPGTQLGSGTPVALTFSVVMVPGQYQLVVAQLPQSSPVLVRLQHRVVTIRPLKSLMLLINPQLASRPSQVISLLLQLLHPA
jgi:hypothetical protein